jgi:hypothetical protein
LAAERQELLAPQEVRQPAIAGEDHAEERARVEVGAGEQAWTAGCISCASSIRSTGRSRVLSRCVCQRARKLLNPLSVRGLGSPPLLSPGPVPWSYAERRRTLG